jgi:dCMP deaminase
LKVLIIGEAGSGKDTVADYLIQKYGFKRYAFADKIKSISDELFPEEVRNNPRSTWQAVGEKFRVINPYCWVDYVLKKIEAEKLDRVVISDCRLPEELAKCEEAGFIPVIIKCSPELRRERLQERDGRVLSEKELNHHTEKFVSTLQPKYCWLIDNDGSLKELHNTIDAHLWGRLEPVPPALIPRPSWDDLFMDVTRVIAQRSTCMRRKVGAVLVKDNRIIATGYNGAPKELLHCTDDTCLRTKLKVPSGQKHELCRAVHAETNCVIQAATFGVSTVGSTIYVSCYPCSLCARTLVNAGITHVVYEDDYIDPLATEIFKEAGIEMTKYTRRNIDIAWYYVNKKYNLN